MYKYILNYLGPKPDELYQVLPETPLEFGPGLLLEQCNLAPAQIKYKTHS